MFRWKARVITMPTSSSLVASEVVITTTYDNNSDDKVGIMTTLGFYLLNLQSYVARSSYYYLYNIV